jgi:hypothetical protein
MDPGKIAGLYWFSKFLTKGEEMKIISVIGICLVLVFVLAPSIRF